LASGKIKEATGAPLWLHPADKPLWLQLEKQCQLFGIRYEPIPEPDCWLDESTPLDLADGKVLHTPGHSPGSCCFYFENSNLLIAGDTLFSGSIGRTDLFGGSFDDITRSIREKIYTLPDSVRIITGHGIDTSVAYEKQHNPFVRP
jgi:glyoxylase-like metal-dependent hydrolase (beta-lactamase superfamily II)